ncbi:MAG TPA: CheR family methyltransferase [Gemmatimonadaceae bacterium]|nr:CheR family methyltransferase [Gemmatimonadaceae bacterium]
MGAEPGPRDGQELETLLEFLQKSRNFDFNAYKRPTLVRRLERRMRTLGLASYPEYRDALAKDPGEFDELFNALLINVTDFFRDEIPWVYMTTVIVPRILESKGPDETIRIWSAGCATGEEAYTLVMTLAEHLGIEEFRQRVKVYATDVDTQALTTARQGIYSSKEIGSVPVELREKYFERVEARYAFRKDLRRCMVFGRHDLLHDAPVSKVDLLVCRNTLMYFTASAQARIIARFHFALSEGGFLFLGRAETLLAHSATFAAVDIGRRVFRKVPPVRLATRLTLVSSSETPGIAPDRDDYDEVRGAAFEISTPAQLVVDKDGKLILANAHARSLFKIQKTDIGRSFHELEVSYRPVELRSMIDEAYDQRRVMIASDVKWDTPNGDSRWLDVQVMPLTDMSARVIGVNIAFADSTKTKTLQRKIEQANLALESAYEQLQSTNEELETTNEELQSTVEELETTNEELHATNEELGTLNDELQSTNEELQAMNDVAGQYTDDLDTANLMLESISTSLGHRLIVVDSERRVTMWNAGSEELWGMRLMEVRHSLLDDLDSGLPVPELLEPVKLVLNGTSAGETVDALAINRKGRQQALTFRIVPLLDPEAGNVKGAVILAEESGSSA